MTYFLQDEDFFEQKQLFHTCRYKKLLCEVYGPTQVFGFLDLGLFVTGIFIIDRSHSNCRVIMAIIDRSHLNCRVIMIIIDPQTKNPFLYPVWKEIFVHSAQKLGIVRETRVLIRKKTPRSEKQASFLASVRNYYFLQIIFLVFLRFLFPYR